MKFKEKFNKKYVCIGDTIEIEKNGVRYIARIVYDDTHHIDDDDVHNLDQSVTGCDDKQQKELIHARDAWFNDEWHYVGIVIDMHKGEWKRENAASLWGIEANYPSSKGIDNSYLNEVANELLVEIA